ncbi:MAG TPA: hypothetical protein GXX55_02445 [Firmicutes bacterium]|nr:hypothetical protein [Bacillota bacterium]
MNWLQLATSRGSKCPRLVTTVAAMAVAIGTATVPGLAFSGRSEPVCLHPSPVSLVLLLLPGATWSDLSAPEVAPAWDWVFEHAAAGLMNSRSGSGFDPTGALLTLGAGARALRLPADAGTAYQRGEHLYGIPAEEWYWLWTGRRAQPGALLFPGIEAVRHAHARADHLVSPGLLGEWLREHGYLAAAFGNADAFDTKNRAAILVLMDEAGIVPRGQISPDLLLPDPDVPGGKGLDEEKIGRLVEAELRSGTALVMVEWSDLVRLEETENLFRPGRYEELRRRELAAAGRWLARWEGRWRAAAGGPVVLLVVSPYPGREALRRGELLMPALLYDSGRPPGLLTSATTRWSGIVANLDVAPTIALLLSGYSPWGESKASPADTASRSARAIPIDAPADELMRRATGRAWVVEPASSAAAVLRELGELAARTTAVSATRPGILRGYVLAWIIVSLVSLAVLLHGATTAPPPGSARRAWLAVSRVPLSLAILSLTLVPLALMVASPIYSHGAGLALTAILAGSALVSAGLLALWRRPYPALLWVAGLLVAGLITDTLTGSNWMRRSVLGYDPAVGARYYGIGNEYMGILVGATTLFWTGLLDRLMVSAGRERALPSVGRWVLARGVGLVGGLTVLAVGLPFWGANFGGALTAAAAWAVAMLGVREERGARERHRRGFGLTGRNWVWVLLALLVLVAALVVLDASRPAAVRSHLGLLAEAVKTGGIGVLLQTVDRKLATNLKIMRYSIWTWGFAIGLVVLTLLFLRPTPGFRRLLADRPCLARGMMASTVASLVAFAANDSGVVAAATTLLVPASGLLILGLEAGRRGE